MNEVTGARRGYQAFELDAASRSRLAQQFPPKFPEFIGHHITYAFGVMSDEELPHASKFSVIGYICDEDGLEALVVSVDGSPRRPDGKLFHITWSLDREAGFKPVHSNDLLSDGRGYERVDPPISIDAIPKFF